ncbi:MAG: endonuclease III, partial [Deltaproteobacteria bacterium]|nr:endonuclease III [Deltaproteobacteria bacterium]
DTRVHIVTPPLVNKYPTPQAKAKAKPEELMRLIQSTGFFRNKAKSILGFCQGIVARHGGKVPQTMEELIKLPGIGRKSANAILGYAFGVPGIVVDTHMIRLSNRMGFTKHKDPVKIEHDLMTLIPKKEWTKFSSCMVWHGRRCCVARKPLCSKCPIGHLCPSYGIGI